jgi:hypothetical protein
MDRLGLSEEEEEERRRRRSSGSNAGPATRTKMGDVARQIIEAADVLR